MPPIHACVHAGVSLSFRGVAIPNDSYVDIGDFDDISANRTEVCDAHALLCHTDKSNCCNVVQTLHEDMLLGDWYFPNGTIVESFIRTLNSGLCCYFARNRGLSVIRLYVSGVPTERGRFLCEIPNANGVTHNLRSRFSCPSSPQMAMPLSWSMLQQ